MNTTTCVSQSIFKVRSLLYKYVFCINSFFFYQFISHLDIITVLQKYLKKNIIIYIITKTGFGINIKIKHSATFKFTNNIFYILFYYNKY